MGNVHYFEIGLTCPAFARSSTPLLCAFPVIYFYYLENIIRDNANISFDSFRINVDLTGRNGKEKKLSH